MTVILPLKFSEDPIVRSVTKTVIDITPELKTLAKDMCDTMAYNSGIGIASTQVGKDIRLAVVNTIDAVEDGQFLIMFNPEVLDYEQPVESREGCLSCPGANKKVTRYDRVSIKYQDIQGITRFKQLSGLTARAAQHEISHLNGALIIDKEPNKL